MLQVYSLLLYSCYYSDCLLLSECCQMLLTYNSIVCLNASCESTDGALKLMLLLC